MKIELFYGAARSLVSYIIQESLKAAALSEGQAEPRKESTFREVARSTKTKILESELLQSTLREE